MHSIAIRSTFNIDCEVKLMKEKLHPHKVGLTLGIFAGLGHVVWSLLVVMGLAKPLVDWLLSLHFVSVSFTLASFDLTNTALLVVVAVVWGYIVGYVFASVWNWVLRSKL